MRMRECLTEHMRRGESARSLRGTLYVTLAIQEFQKHCLNVCY